MAKCGNQCERNVKWLKAARKWYYINMWANSSAKPMAKMAANGIENEICQ
jgi:hypothetical protein